jgi:ABC-2 type transport system permease protein
MAWTALKTLVRRECGVIARYWLVTVVPPAIATLLYFAIFGEVLGHDIGPLDGIGYVELLTPGLIALSVIPYSFSHAAAGLLGARQFRFMEELLVAPVPHWIILAGYGIGGIMRGLLVALITLSIASFFADLRVHSFGISAFALLLVATVSAIAGLVTGILATSFEQVGLFQALIVIPLALLGGVFTPFALIPAWARTISLANPVLYMVNAVRGGFLGTSDVPMGTSIAMLLAFVVVLLLVALALVSKGTLSR